MLALVLLSSLLGFKKQILNVFVQVLKDPQRVLDSESESDVWLLLLSEHEHQPPMIQTALIQNAHNDLVTDACYDMYGLYLATCGLDQR